MWAQGDLTKKCYKTTHLFAVAQHQLDSKHNYLNDLVNWTALKAKLLLMSNCKQGSPCYVPFGPDMTWAAAVALGLASMA